jgi:hypothetical protein
MNPYQSPTTFTPQARVGNCAPPRVGPGLIAAILVFAVLVGFLAQVVPLVRTITMPRFGWIGLILCLNPLIFLLPWLRSPTRPALMGSAFMTCLLGVINAVQLLFTGTVSIVTNEFTDRLHSSWCWAVLPFFVASGYLYWHARRMNQRVLDPGSGEQLHAPEPADELDSNGESSPPAR